MALLNKAVWFAHVVRRVILSRPHTHSCVRLSASLRWILYPVPFLSSTPDKQRCQAEDVVVVTANLDLPHKEVIILLSRMIRFVVFELMQSTGGFRGGFRGGSRGGAGHFRGGRGGAPSGPEAVFACASHARHT